MSIPEETLRKAISGLVRPEQVKEIKEKNGKVLVTVAVDVPTGEKPAFADQMKTRLRAVPGVKDVFVSFAPTPKAAAPEAPTNPLPGVKHIVAVGAGKGGVGKSTVAVNLAIALAQEGMKVGLLDADIYGPSAAIMTGTSEHKAQGDAHQRVVPAVKHGIRIISMAFLLPKDQSAVVWRGPMVGKMVTQLLTGVAWGELDYLVVDLPPGTGDAVLSLSQSVPLSGAVVVTTPQDVALLDVMKAIEMFRAVKVPVLGVVENMAGFTCPKCGTMTPIFLEGAGRKAAERFDLPLLGSLPLDAAVPPGGDRGSPIVVEASGGATAAAFREIAKRVAGRVTELEREGPGTFNLDWTSGA
ncbi:MAG TPA: Mrp/NBP35 family ATP-binding protein [Candidatus Eisenbacteria bacterium]|nr:Mrp/NBP35 family ATP-binding protein [Candidatus Eisenbacteria bacterium]